MQSPGELYTEPSSFSIPDLDDPNNSHIPSFLAKEALETRPKKHRWTSEERKFLRLLKDGYGNEWSELVPIFNTFAYRSKSQQHGLSREVLCAQWHYIKSSSSKLPKETLATSLSTAVEEGQLRAMIEDIAATLGVRLVRSDVNFHVPRQLPSEQTLEELSLGKRRAAEINLIAPHSKRHCDIGSPRKPTKLTIRNQELGLLTPPSMNSDTNGNDIRCLPVEGSPTLSRRKSTLLVARPQAAVNIIPDNIGSPKLAFRGWSPKSQGINSADEGFRAGAFVDCEVPPCPLMDTVIDEATHHVGWRTDRPSIFISITTSCIRAMMKAHCPESGRYLAILDLHKVQQESSVFAAASLNLRPVTAQGETIPYQSGGEYLVFGQIKSSSIISVVSIDELTGSPPSSIADQDPFLLKFVSTAWRRVAHRCELQKQGPLHLSYGVGIASGRLAHKLSVRSEYLEAIISSIIKDWQFKLAKNEEWTQNEIFCSGVRLGYEGEEVRDLDQLEAEIIDLTGDDNDDNHSVIEELQFAASEAKGPSSGKDLDVISTQLDNGVGGNGAEAHNEMTAINLEVETPDIFDTRSRSKLTQPEQEAQHMQYDHRHWPSWTGM